MLGITAFLFISLVYLSLFLHCVSFIHIWILFLLFLHGSLWLPTWKLWLFPSVLCDLIWIWWMDCIWWVRSWQSPDRDQWWAVPLKDPYWDQYCLKSSPVTQTCGPSALLMSLQVTPNWVVQLTQLRDGMSFRGTQQSWWSEPWNLMKFSEAQCKVLHLGWAMPAINTGWDRKELKADLWKRIWMSSALGWKVRRELKMCAHFPKNTRVLGCI